MFFGQSSYYYILGSGPYTICLENNKSGYAQINKETAHDYPGEAVLKKKGDDMFIAGGKTRDFILQEFELYALFFV